MQTIRSMPQAERFAEICIRIRTYLHCSEYVTIVPLLIAWAEKADCQGGTADGINDDKWSGTYFVSPPYRYDRYYYT